MSSLIFMVNDPANTQDPPPTVAPLLRARDLHKTYRMGQEDVRVLRGVNLVANRGEWLAVMGSSGSGKSTLLHLLGGLDRPNTGVVEFNGTEIFSRGSGYVDRYRNRNVGFVFQVYHLLPELNVFENVLIAAMAGSGPVAWLDKRVAAKKSAHEVIEQVGLSHRLKHRPAKLSGGERQRVAIARALINRPDVLLADEPTGNLDAETGKQVLELFHQFHDAGQTIIMVTHDQKVADQAQRKMLLEAGKFK
jgi:lipoprotein-releasing system ATP-binding protein